MFYWDTTQTKHANEPDGMYLLQLAQDDVIRNSIISVGAKGGTEAGWSPISTARAPAPGVQAAYDEAMDELASAASLLGAENPRREKNDMINIRMLGCDSWLEKTRGDMRGTAFEQNRTDLYDEIEDNRYFVVLMADDFQLLSKQKKNKLLWDTRFSIRQRHHLFDEELPSLALYASRHFGQDSGGLVHNRIPQGDVEVGEVKNLGEVAPPKKRANEELMARLRITCLIGCFG
jgi:hypothetical protein